MTTDNTYSISLKDSQGFEIPATITLGEDDEDECNVRLTFRDSILTATAADYFEAFCKIRLQLEAIGLLPLCFAASCNVYPSPMSRNMGGGLKAYRLTIGQPARSDELVEIFEAEGGLHITTVANQLRFYESWLRSL